MRIIISGSNSYISKELSRWIINTYDEIILLSLRGNEWKKFSFKEGDRVVHCAALVHNKGNKISINEYREVNTKLTLEFAEKAKKEGASQFIFLSTRAVYGKDGSCFRKVIIDNKTELNPKSYYGISKYEAEKSLAILGEESFKVVCIRAPFIYGKNCKGNYNTLRSLVLKVGIIPKIKNEYSMMYIDNLCELINQLILNDYVGIVTPQDMPIHSTYEMAKLIAENNNKKVICTSLFNPLIRIMSIFLKSFRTAFGSEIYEVEMSKIEGIDYSVVSFEDSIKITEL